MALGSYPLEDRGQIFQISQSANVVLGYCNTSASVETIVSDQITQQHY